MGRQVFYVKQPKKKSMIGKINNKKEKEIVEYSMLVQLIKHEIQMDFFLVVKSIDKVN